ncbi:hypothetical protein JOF56_008114 [Kibdelosporangium banguiense]|uniref:Uncharacterized protein n=1 Tax=Kibdelosporangium banguiense TaxID=1365924 RepID=A0ABS4TUT0_9PSEU|nr:hypothetical protein [Kibdelosporangium banguiense]
MENKKTASPDSRLAAPTVMTQKSRRRARAAITLDLPADTLTRGGDGRITALHLLLDHHDVPSARLCEFIMTDPAGNRQSCFRGIVATRGPAQV